MHCFLLPRIQVNQRLFWGFTWLEFAFIIFSLTALAVIIQLASRLFHYEHGRPRIEITPNAANERAILEVRNGGREAEFTAKARVVSRGTPADAEWYTLYWESESHNTKIRIDQDGLQTILVGRKSNHTVVSQFIFDKGLVLYRVGGEGEQEFPASTAYTKQITETKTRYWIEEEATIEVLITSSPPMKSPFQAEYAVKIIPGLVGIDLVQVEH